MMSGTLAYCTCARVNMHYERISDSDETCLTRSLCSMFNKILLNILLQITLKNFRTTVLWLIFFDSSKNYIFCNLLFFSFMIFTVSQCNLYSFVFFLFHSLINKLEIPLGSASRAGALLPLQELLERFEKI